MTSGPVVISVENLSKCYQISHKSVANETFREMLGRQAKGMARSLTGHRRTEYRDKVEEFWALKDVSFEVRQGEVMGVIGRNGAGKSTLLKVLSQITAPTSGRVTLHGRVASLLEVGTGFHPELTGRENIYLNGAILGMTRQEINQRFDEIVDFAEIERFLDTPVKRYSSGMYVRLAFAVASHMEPEILIIDEVLAVGDIAFQKKCMGKIQNVAENGRTIIFVSHNIAAVRKLCDSVLLIDGGKTRSCGAVDSIISDYFALIEDPMSRRQNLNAPGAQSVTIHNRAGSIVATVDDIDQYVIKFRILVRPQSKMCQVAFTIFNSEDIGLISAISPSFDMTGKGTAEIDVSIPTNMLNIGSYRIEGAIFDSFGLIEQVECFAIFQVIRTSFFDQKHPESRGLIRFDANWHSDCLQLPAD